MSNIDEYYLTNRPTVYPDVMIKQVIQDMKLNYNAVGHIDKFHFTNIDHDYIEHIQKQMIHKLADSMWEDKKVKLQTYESPIHNSVSVKAEVIVMTEEDLFNLLQKFGVYVRKQP